MENRTEEVTLVADGSKKNVVVGYLSFESRNKIFSQYIKLGFKGDGAILESIDFFGMKNAILSATLRDVKVGDITQSDGDRIFDKYFSDILQSIKGDDSKN